MMDRSSALIFDCDGTLVDSMPLHYRSWRATLGRYSVEFTEERFYSLAGQPTWRIVELLSAEQGIQLEPYAIAREKEDHYRRILTTVLPLHPIVAIARQSRGRMPMAVASGGWRDITRMQLEHVGILDWFETVVTAEDTERHKPDPDVFLEAARRMGVDPAACTVYEDAELGIEAARRAGMKCVDVRPMLVAQT